MMAVSSAWADAPVSDTPAFGAATENCDPKHTIADVKAARERRGSFMNVPLPNRL
jgi:hypothetical protein